MRRLGTRKVQLVFHAVAASIDLFGVLVSAPVIGLVQTAWPESPAGIRRVGCFSEGQVSAMSLFLFFASALGAIMFGLLDFLVQTS